VVSHRYFFTKFKVNYGTGPLNFFDIMMITKSLPRQLISPCIFFGEFSHLSLPILSYVFNVKIKVVFQINRVMDNTHKKEDNEVEGRCNCGSIRKRFSSGLTPGLPLSYWFNISNVLFLFILSTLTTGANRSDNCRRCSGGSTYSTPIKCCQSMPEVARNIDRIENPVDFDDH
jgi:hypothetical protein